MRPNRLLALLVLVVAIVLGACGSDPSPDSAPSEKPSEVEVTSFTTGEVSLEVPSGWTVVGANESMDGYDDEDEPLHRVYVVKSGEGEPDAFSNPGIQVTYFDEDVSMVEVSKGMYENTRDLDPISLDNYTWTGFAGESLGKPLAILVANPGQDDADQFQTAVWLNMGDGQEITLDDEDVLAILSSIQPA